ncbi:DUF2062 domain-containing protein [Plesiomonas shigelloides]|uniref:DUF2062 domain-containing protein n=1 Tax=Plesiomonas shigelloides TaxID=703 RepID=UPI000D136C18|nr:DUF2062 domain-containing protein [Plesiomonas shigelloides]AVQ86637.1 DUF2062 domain-containing protein [Plesiomonas shigelloides]
MLKQFIQKYLPSQEAMQNHKSLRILNRWLHHANLWNLNRRSASGAFAVGLFVAFIPLPCQMLLAAAGAILLRVNLPLSVALVWLTNPVTMPPIFYCAYKVGSWILGTPPFTGEVHFTTEWMMQHFSHLFTPFLLGSFVCGIVAAIVGYFAIRGIWRYSVTRNWQKRRQRNLNS